MELQGTYWYLRGQSVTVLEGEVAATIRDLASHGVGSKAIGQTVRVARNTVRRYLRRTIPAGVQTRPKARRVSESSRAEARLLYERAREG
jgi:transposase-like protein